MRCCLRMPPARCASAFGCRPVEKGRNRTMERLTKNIGFAVLVFIVLLFVGLMSAIPVYFLWNAVVPDIFHLPPITFWQALGLALLATCLFKSNGGSSSKS